MEHQLTIVIPTKNRAAFLARALHYYADVSCEFPILIGDSSDEHNLRKTRELTKSIGSRLEIRHLIDPAPSTNSPAGWQTDHFLRGLLDHIETPYVAFYADDDFAVVKNLRHGIAFLEKNRDYSFVCGHAAMFVLRSGTANGQLAGLGPYIQGEYHHDDPLARLRHLMRNYSVLEYGISRTTEKKFRWGKVFESGVDNLTGELLNCFLVVLQGKAKRLDRLCLVRQVHSQQVSSTHGDVFDWVSGVLFQDHYRTLRDIVSEELAKRAGINATQAEEAFKQGFWFYMSGAMWRKHPDNRARMRHGILRRKASQVPGTRALMGKLRALSGRGLSLQAALNPVSLYHADFMPIYRAITTIHADQP
jgi:glycosyltransferase domain-containing protein